MKKLLTSFLLVIATLIFVVPVFSVLGTAEDTDSTAQQSSVAPLTSEDERAQNHFADMCNYHKLDLTNFNNPSLLPDANKQGLYDAFSKVNQSTSKEEAQKIIDEYIASSFVQFDGYSVKTEGEGDELAAIFTVNNDRIQDLVAQGFTVTYGGLLASADIAASDLVYNSENSNVYSYFLFSNKDGVTVTPQFLSQSAESNVFGMSVYFDEHTRLEEYGKDYVFRSFVVLEKDDEEVVIYIDASSDKIKGTNSLYSVMSYLTQTKDAYKNNQKLLDTVEKSFNYYDIYVDEENGNDANGDGTANSPYASIAKAVEMAEEIINSATMPSVTIKLMGGIYELSDTVVLDNTKLTPKYYQLHFAGCERDRETTISGTFSIDGGSFSLYDEGKNIWVYQLDNQYKNADGSYIQFSNLYVNGKMATLAETPWFETAIDEYTPADDPYYTLTEKPDENYVLVWVPEELLTDLVRKNPTTGKYEFVSDNQNDSMRWSAPMRWYYYDLLIEGIDLDITNNITNIPNMYYLSKGIYDGDYNTRISTSRHIALKFYGDQGRVFTTSHASVGTFWTNDRNLDTFQTKLRGNMAFLDKGGEFYYDSTSGKLYYIPAEDESIEDITFGVPTLEALFSLKDVHDISFENITFSGTDAKYLYEYGYTGGQAASQKRTFEEEGCFIREAAVLGKDVTSIKISGCNFEELFFHAVHMYGLVDRIVIDSNHFENIGGGAVHMGSGTYEDNDHNTNLTITNNYLHEIGMYYMNNCAITLLNARNADVLYNTIIDCVYTGISLGWGWIPVDYYPDDDKFNVDNTEVAYNYIENSMYFTFDGAPIYTLGGSANREYAGYLNSIHHNYLYMGSKSGHIVAKTLSCAIYHDGASTHWHTHNNVVWVDRNNMPGYGMIAMQGSPANAADHRSQAWHIRAENNYFINLYEKHFTCPYKSVRKDAHNSEVNSYMLTLLKPDEFNDTYRNLDGTKLTVNKDPKNWDYFFNSGETENMNAIIANAGCDLDGGIYKNAEYENIYDYYYRLLTEEETWWSPLEENPNFADE